MSVISIKLRALRKAARINCVLKEIDRRSAPYRVEKAIPHGLPKPLIVSLTSYRNRFDTLAFTLKSILFQTVRPDTTILWVSYEDYPLLPQNVLDLRRYGLEIASCVDMRSYKKIIPTLQNYRDTFVITVDDDVYYKENCIEKLVKAYAPAQKHVICHRAHMVVLTSDAVPAPYLDWHQELRRSEISPLVFPTGVQGILYPPDAFHEDVCNVAMFSVLSPSADDVWLYWMWRLKGYLGHRLAGRTRIIEWPGSQMANLMVENVTGGGNDFCIRNMTKKYGFPKLAQ